MINLTPDEIDALPVGEQLDALVAEHVMGEPHPPVTQHEFHMYPEASPAKNWYCSLAYDTGDICRWQPLPFSSDWEYAGKVIDRMIELDEKERYFSLEHYIYFGGGQTYMADFGAFSYGETGPLAVCRAALRTIRYTSPL